MQSGCQILPKFDIDFSIEIILNIDITLQIEINFVLFSKSFIFVPSQNTYLD